MVKVFRQAALLRCGITRHGSLKCALLILIYVESFRSHGIKEVKQFTNSRTRNSGIMAITVKIARQLGHSAEHNSNRMSLAQ